MGVITCSTLVTSMGLQIMQLVTLYLTTSQVALPLAQPLIANPVLFLGAKAPVISLSGVHFSFL